MGPIGCFEDVSVTLVGRCSSSSYDQSIVFGLGESGWSKQATLPVTGDGVAVLSDIIALSDQCVHDGNAADSFRHCTTASLGWVYLFTRQDSTWAEVEVLKPVNPYPGVSAYGIYFGMYLHFSQDGSMLSVIAGSERFPTGKSGAAYLYGVSCLESYNASGQAGRCACNSNTGTARYSEGRPRCCTSQGAGCAEDGVGCSVDLPNNLVCSTAAAGWKLGGTNGTIASGLP